MTATPSDNPTEMTCGSMTGDTRKRAPRFTAVRASSVVRTVPAPTIRSGRRANSSTRSSAPGIVRVNSTIRKPPRTAASMAETAVSRAGHLRIAEALTSPRRPTNRSGFMTSSF